MPRTAAATMPAGPTPFEELLDRGRSQGHLSLDEVRAAFHEAGITPTQGRSIIRELTDAGVRLASEDKTEAASTKKGTATVKKARPARAKSRTTAKAKAAKAETEAPQAETATDPDTMDVPATELESDDYEVDAPTDLDDQSSVMGDSVHTYLKAIGRRQLLTAAQEVELAKRIEAGLYAEHKLETETGLSESDREDLELVAEDGRRAKAHMLEANLRLVVSVAKKYADRGLSLLDVVQEGNLGLIRAVEKFDYTKGYKFSTYAMWWIRQAIQRGFADSARTIRLPVHVLEMLSKLSRVERDMHQRLGREPTPEELAVELDKSPAQVQELLRTSRQPISLDSTIGEDGETRIGDLIEDTDSPEASELVDRQLMADQLRRALSVLSPREEKIMAMRFGLYDGTPRTLDEIGKHLGLTRERIRQLEKESLSKLRHPSNAQPLLDFAS
ncbi:RNA polymerase sigma factor [Actinoallomurus rhizosphaericola]|uniref:RNA polymerase sigma factor n=1 Tax=Actinoallomurus rhizosphaericola TaxID=2952536 RepID=UPI002093893E|nr:RNA polymerase sigma factor [Actinoallomurus rhizosphaericola]MCO5995154.1 RNA polymerase sigma factor [Actinoallomurus rhizosphaericola]